MKKKNAGWFCVWVFSLFLLLPAGSVWAADAGSAVPAVPGTNMTARISAGGESAFFSFAPDETAYYVFSSSAGTDDTIGYLYDEEMYELEQDDDGGEEGNFRILHELEAGCTYYYEARYYDESKTGSIPVRLEQFDGLLRVEADGDTVVHTPPESYVTLGVTAVSGGAGLSYQWYNNATGKLTGQTSPAARLKPVKRIEGYDCVVTDTYGNSMQVSFTVYVNNDLVAESKDGPDVYTPLNGTAVLEVAASCTVGNLTYQWHACGTDSNGGWFDNVISGATSASYTIPNVQKLAQYYCRVRDGYSNFSDVYFTVHVDSGLTAARTGERLVYTEPGGSVVLEVQASCTTGTVSYEWHRKYMDPWSVVYDKVISGASSDTYTVPAVTQSGDTYYCVVRDAYGDSVTLEYQVDLDNHLTVSAQGSTEILTEAGRQTVLQVNASCAVGSLTYTWYKGWSETIEGASSNTLTVAAADEAVQYHCEVADAYGALRDIWFTVTPVGDVTALPAEQPVSAVMPESGGYLFFRLTPEKTGEYRICCTPEGSFSSYALTLYDAGMQEIAASDIRSESLRHICQLEAGQEYIAAVKSYSYGSESLEIVLAESAGLRAFIREDLLRGAAAYSLQEDFVSMDVRSGEAVTLGVLAYCRQGDIAFQWYREGYDAEGRWYTEAIAEAQDSVFVTAPVTEAQYYCCAITDGSGDCIRKSFSLAPAGLLARSGQDLSVLAAVGETVLLDPDVWAADDAVSYQWYFISAVDAAGTQQKLQGETGETCTFVFAPEKAGVYCCKAEDAAEEQSVTVRISVAEKKAPVSLVLGQETAASVPQSGDAAVFSYLPEETGVYTLTVEGTRLPVSCTLYDSAWNRICANTGMDANYTVSSTLEAGKTYYLSVRYEDSYTAGTFRVKLTRLEEQAADTGLRLLTEELFTGDMASLVVESAADYVELWADNGESVTLAAAWNHEPGREKLFTWMPEESGCVQYTARAYYAGYYADSTTASVTVVQRPDIHADRILTLPAAVAVIEEEAFAGSAMEEIILPEGCRTIGERAFADCGALRMVYMPDSITDIAGNAFEGCDVIFLCESKNTAYAFAEATGLTHVAQKQPDLTVSGFGFAADGF